MASAVRRNVGLRETGEKTAVADNDVARMMYYLRSVSLDCGLDIIQDDLVDYKNYARLSQRRADQVFEAAYQFSPDEFHKYVSFAFNNRLFLVFSSSSLDLKQRNLTLKSFADNSTCSLTLFLQENNIFG